MRPHEPDEGSQDKDLQRARARIGKVLRGKYRVDRLLGVGGMASVFSATHLRNANCVAVKILHSGLAIERDLRARFLREGYASNSVGHPGTVRVLDDDTTEDGALFLVMELLDGETLDARWERSHHKLGVREVVTLVSELLDVLAAAHAKGIIHRDIKPENLFLTREGKVKVLDFGVARLREASATHTGSGAVFGTPAFMPPEQALGHVNEVDALSDVWAVGATAFLLLSGRFVHEAATAAEFVVRAATLKAPPLTSVAPEVPGPVAHVIDRALAFDKDDRWASASAMRDALVKAWSDGAGATVDGGEIERDDLTRLAPASRAVKPGEGSDEGDLATLQPMPVSSTVAGVASDSEARRGRSQRKRALVGAGAGLFTLAVIVAALTSSRERRIQPPAGASALDPRAPAPSASPTLASTRQGEPAATSTASGALPWVPVEALPKADEAPKAPPSPSPVAPARVPAPAPFHARATTAPAASLPAPGAAPAPPSTPKRDPLSPW